MAATRNTKAIHYAGPLLVLTKRSVRRILGGWAACCSGERAERVRDLGQHSWDRAEVTCKACLRAIAAADEGKRTWPDEYNRIQDAYHAR